ncbi:MAG: ABC transporter ATP-binding protein [Candidatus Tectomicrobia bacterium]|nr:ABC transporter ATP-binding protein [Candidatus Tectomicrobia bacterium]
MGAPAKIRVEGVSKTFRSGVREVPALEGIHLDVREGEFVSILGESGCGKTTLLRIVAGLIFPSLGRVVLDGSAVTGPRREMGFVFQQSVLLDWRTVMENVLLPVEIFRLRRDGFQPEAQKLLDLMGLSGFEGHYPVQLSGGMQQRVAIARALILKPSVLLMDEPFGALDAITREQMNLELLRIWSLTRNTALFVTHDIAEAVFLSDRVLLLSSRPGRVKEVFEVSLPRPRVLEHRYQADFIHLCREIKRAMA